MLRHTYEAPALRRSTDLEHDQTRVPDTQKCFECVPTMCSERHSSCGDAATLDACDNTLDCSISSREHRAVDALYLRA